RHPRRRSPLDRPRGPGGSGLHTPGGRGDARGRQRGRGRRGADRGGAARGSDVTETRIQTPEVLPEDDVERSLRPRRLDDFIGQEPIKDQLQVALEAAAARPEGLDHVLLAGPPGLGNTSLAQIVATEMEVPFVATAGPAL